MLDPVVEVSRFNFKRLKFVSRIRLVGFTSFLNAVRF